MKSSMNPTSVRTLFVGRTNFEVNYCRKLIRIAFSLAVLGCIWLIAQIAAGASFSSASPLLSARGSHTATVLSNGKLLVAGGETNIGFTSATAELYDPATGAWATIASMNADREHHTATMLPNGKILVRSEERRVGKECRSRWS